MKKFYYVHIHTGVVIDDLEKEVIPQIKNLKNGEKKEITTRQSIKSPSTIVEIDEETKKYVTWVLRGSRKHRRPVIDKVWAEKLGLIKKSDEVFSAIKRVGGKYIVQTAFVFLGEEHRPPHAKEQSKEFQDFWRNHALIKEPDAEDPRLGAPWWSMPQEDYEDYWKILNNSSSTPEARLSAKIALNGKK